MCPGRIIITKTNVSHVADDGLEQNVSTEIGREETGGGSEGVEEFGDGKRVSEEEDTIMRCDVLQSAPHYLKGIDLILRAAEMQQVFAKESLIK